jgi:hypothetical protein
MRHTILSGIVVLGSLAPAFVAAEPVVLKAHFDAAAGPNQYRVDFSSLGGDTLILSVTGGSFEIETDAEAGTARLLAWHQDVDPIEIVPGMSTGPIVVTMQEGSGAAGTYDATTRQFEATATFLIDFDDSQLADLGFSSPMVLVGTERGNIYGVGSIGSIGMYLEGEGTVQGLPFTYTCQTTARFEYLLEDHQAQTGDVTRDRALDISDPVMILGGLFQGAAMACPAAADVNGDETTDLSDAVYLLNYLFLGGPETPADPVDCEGASA